MTNTPKKQTITCTILKIRSHQHTTSIKKTYSEHLHFCTSSILCTLCQPDMLPCLGSWRNPTLSGVYCQWSRIRLEKKVTLGEVELQSEATNILLFMGPFTSSKHSLSCDVAGLGERHLNRSICLWEGRMAEYVMRWEQRFGGQSDQILRMCVCIDNMLEWCTPVPITNTWDDRIEATKYAQLDYCFFTCTCIIDSGIDTSYTGSYRHTHVLQEPVWCKHRIHASWFDTEAFTSRHWRT